LIDIYRYSHVHACTIISTVYVCTILGLTKNHIVVDRFTLTWWEYIVYHMRAYPQLNSRQASTSLDRMTKGKKEKNPKDLNTLSSAFEYKVCTWTLCVLKKLDPRGFDSLRVFRLKKKIFSCRENPPTPALSIHREPSSVRGRLLICAHTRSPDPSCLLTCALAWGERGDFFTLGLKSAPWGSNSGPKGCLRNY
jgi:hypothetical protein